jgi:hypothetical protein
LTKESYGTTIPYEQRIKKERIMKLGLKNTIRLLVIALLLGGCLLAFADELTVNIVPQVLQSFDPGDMDKENYRTWELFPSKFGFDTEGNSLWEHQLVKAWPQALYGRNRDNEDLEVLGIHGAFLRKGYNWVEIVPGVGEGENFEPKPIQIPGRADAIDLWVWGSNYAYDLEIHLRDFQGIDHVLKFGSIQFIGWKNLRVRIPASIPQAWKYLPRLKNLEVTKLVLWTTPTEKVDDFYLYLDQLKVVSDIFESRYDGDELADVDTLQEVWGTGTE